MNFYTTLTAQRNDSDDLRHSIESCVEKLLTTNTSPARPGVLLGKIQSGKTRAFIGIMALAFDKGIDAAIVLTKNSQLLGEQTTRRLRKDLATFRTAGLLDVEYVNDFIGTKLKKSQLLNKKVFVAIKNTKNVEKLIKIFTEDNPVLKNQRILIIDDEADYGSVGYKNTPRGSEDDPEMLGTAEKLNVFRQKLEQSFFLQVTATPYALYLQPEEIVINGSNYEPIAPAFTEILKDHSGYVGGHFYFEDARDASSPAIHLHIATNSEEVATLSSKRQDARIVANVAKTSKLTTFRRAVDNFIVGVAIRRAQYVADNDLTRETKVNLLPRFAFIFHIDTGKNKMAWQQQLLDCYLQCLCDDWQNTEAEMKERFTALLETEFAESIEKGHDQDWPVKMPDVEEVMYQIGEIFRYEDFKSQLVNSDERIIQLADEEGQLKLQTGLNFFVGGQVLDRGITIDNLIGFYYGRNPQRMQMDTVLQHARMYGNRQKADLCVTRFYTTTGILQRMQEMHDMDEALRDALTKTSVHRKAIVCIQKSGDGRIIPTSPNRIKLSDLTTLKTHKTLSPYGFETHGVTRLTRVTEKLDSYLSALPGYTETMGQFFNITGEQFDHIVKAADSSFLNYDEGVALDFPKWKAIQSRLFTDLELSDMHCYVQKGRTIRRYQRNGEPSDSVFTSSTDYRYAKEHIATANKPVLMLFRQEGREADDWKGAPFYWPVLVMPNMARPELFQWSES